MSSIFVKLCICICVLAVVCDTRPNQIFLRNRRARFCGRQLADALAMVCNAVYYMPRQERSESAKALLTVPAGQLWRHVGSKDSVVFNLQHLADHANMSTEPKGMLRGAGKSQFFSRESRQGIVNECCRNSCSVQQLQAYCGAPTDQDEDYQDE